VTTDEGLHRIDVAADPVTRADLVRLATADGPQVSLLMPTPRMGPDTRLAGKQFARLSELLRRTAADRGVDAALVETLTQAAAGDSFWQHQAEGLALFSGPGGTLVRRLGASLRPEVAVGRPRLRPLLRHQSEGTVFHVLALSTGRVRLLEGDAHTIRELPLGPVPASYDEVRGDRDAQPSLQWSAQGSGKASFHGHGADAASERTRTEKFVRHVAQELRRHLPLDDDGAGPLVLACVPENLALFRAAGGHPRLLGDVCVTGNADRATPAELHGGAWSLVEPGLRRQEREAVTRAQELAGTGLVLSDFDQVLVAAWEGRVERLFVDDHVVTADDPVVADDPVDMVLARVLAGGGHCAVRPPGLDAGDSELVALLRW
jgi:hypothetical protein